MYKHILIATDGSELGNLSVDHGIALAALLKARVTIVNVTERWSALDIAVEARKHSSNPIQQFEAIAVAHAKTALDAASQKARQAGISAETVHVPDQHPAEGIIATAQAKACDLIVDIPCVRAVLIFLMNALWLLYCSIEFDPRGIRHQTQVMEINSM